MSYIPHIQQKEDGSYFCVILHPDKTGSTAFTFSDVEYVRRSELNAFVEVSIHLHEPGETDVDKMQLADFSCRLNLASQSGRESFARSMGKIAKNKQEYDSYLSAAISAVTKAIQSKPRMIRLCDAPPRENRQWMLEPFILDKSPNVLFGEGGGGKTYLALRWMLSLATNIPFLGKKPERAVACMFLDYEDVAAEANDRIQKLCGSPELAREGVAPDLELVQRNIHYFSGEGIPIHELIPQLKEKISEFKIEFILIDSAALACGGEPEKAEVASRFFNSLAKLGVTTLTIAHETKTENHDHVFGSIFWRNCARNIWNAQSERDPSDNRRISLGLFHRKCNHTATQAPVPLAVFHDVGAVDITLGGSEDWGGKSLSIPERVISFLRSGPKQFGQIVDELHDVKKDALTEALRRMKSRGVLVKTGMKEEYWKIA